MYSRWTDEKYLVDGIAVRGIEDIYIYIYIAESGPRRVECVKRDKLKDDDEEDGMKKYV